MATSVVEGIVDGGALRSKLQERRRSTSVGSAHAQSGGDLLPKRRQRRAHCRLPIYGARRCTP